MAAAGGIDTDFTKITWKQQPTLPSLPVPALADTMKRYLKSCEPLYSAEELAHTKAVVADFLKTSGPELQAIIEDKAATERNWVSESLNLECSTAVCATYLHDHTHRAWSIRLLTRNPHLATQPSQ